MQDVPSLQIAMEHHQAGRLAEAEAIYRQRLATDPTDSDALHLLGMLAHQCGHTEAGIDLIRQAIALAPGEAIYHNNLGSLLAARGERTAAIALFQAAIDLAPDYSDAHLNLARQGMSLGEFERAAGHFHHLIRLNGQSAAAWFGLGNCLEKLARTGEAEAAYGRCLALDPGMPPALRCLGDLARQGGRLGEAAAHYQRLTALCPDDAEAWANLGAILQTAKDNSGARSCIERALALDPGIAIAWSNLGNTYLAEDRFEEALALFDRAVALAPDYATGHHNRGVALKELARLPEAVEAYRAALALDPGFGQSRWALAQCLLHQGQYPEAWQGYEARWQVVGEQPDFQAPPWDGRPLPDGTLLLYAEQGLGDTLQFIRYVALVAPLVKDLVLQVHPPLHRLFARLPGVTRMVGLHDDPGPFDRQIALMSLPGLLGTTVETIPAPIPYLAAPDDLVEAWRERLGPATGRRVGLVWSGNPDQGRNHLRSTPLEDLRPLLDCPGVSFFSLQKGPPAAQLDGGAPWDRITPLGDSLTDMADTAAAMANLDLIVTVDTSIAHLAGALGRPVWVMLCRVPDWRYLMSGPTTPWYPGMRLFRQPDFKRWDLVADEVAASLRQWATGP